MTVGFIHSAIGDDEINMDEIKGIATNDDYVFHATTYGEVQKLTDAIAEMICQICISISKYIHT